MASPVLFQDEPDEDSGPDLFQDEEDEGGNFLFQDESAEREDHGGPSHSKMVKDHGLSFLRDEPDEQPQFKPVLFGTEDDEVESDSGSDGSAYFGDCEKEKLDAHAIVQLNFSTIARFLSSQLSKAGTEPLNKEPVKKKRRYNNQNRERVAETRRNAKLPASRQRVPRNSPDSSLPLSLIFYFFDMCDIMICFVFLQVMHNSYNRFIWRYLWFVLSYACRPFRKDW